MRLCRALLAAVALLMLVAAPAHAGKVLLCQDFGGRHQRTLMTTLDCGQERRDSNHSLATADISFEQS
mgnify:CR=1 FL=1